MPNAPIPEREGTVTAGGIQGEPGPAPPSTLAERLARTEAELARIQQENAQLRRALQASEYKFQCLVEQSLIGISLYDGQCFTYVNPRYAEITGYSIDELMQMGPLDIISPEERAQAEALIRRGLAGEVDKNFTATIRVVRKDGSVVTTELTGGPPVEVDGHPELLGMLVDITARVHAEDEIRHLNKQLVEQATRDPLTGLFNRRYLDETLTRELTRAEREEKQVSLVMGDVDGFKDVNDTHGHRFGDDALRLFTGLIRQHSRRSDIPCRFGGDEFLLVLPDMGYQKACERAELLRRIIADTPIVIDDVTVKISASFGVATYPEHACDADALIAAADRALYRAKKAGRNRVSGFGDQAIVGPGT